LAEDEATAEPWVATLARGAVLGLVAGTFAGAAFYYTWPGAPFPAPPWVFAFGAGAGATLAAGELVAQRLVAQRLKAIGLIARVASGAVAAPVGALLGFGLTAVAGGELPFVKAATLTERDLESLKEGVAFGATAFALVLTFTAVLAEKVGVAGRMVAASLVCSVLFGAPIAFAHGTVAAVFVPGAVCAIYGVVLAVLVRLVPTLGKSWTASDA
jgi:hypothetical protein